MTDNDQSALRQLASLVVSAIHSWPEVLDNQIIDVPDFTEALFDPSAITESNQQLHAFRFVEQLVAKDYQGSMKEIVEQFHQVKDLLVWGQAPGYNVENVGQHFLDNYCHALLTGPDGPLKCDAPLGSFVIFGPNTLYKDHSHVPNEVYLAISGGGEWRVGEHDWRELAAGETIFIPSETTHAIRTASEPLLTFSFWLEAGDIASIEI